MRTTALLGLFTLSLLTACAGTIDRRVDPDSPDAVGGAVLQSQDIRTMAKKMADDIRASGVLTSQADGQTVTFHITELKNESSDVINRSIVLNKLRTELFKALGNGPVNPAAAAMVPAELKPLDPGSPENYARQIPADAEWYAANRATVLNQYLEAIS